MPVHCCLPTLHFHQPIPPTYSSLFQALRPLAYHPNAVSKTPCPNHFCDLGVHSPGTAVDGRRISSISRHDEDVSLIRLSLSLSLAAMSPSLLLTTMSLSLSLAVMSPSSSFTPMSPSLSLTLMFPFLSRVAVSRSFISIVILVLSCCLVVLREMWHVVTCWLYSVRYIQVLYIHGNTMFHLALQMYIARQQHLVRAGCFCDR